MSISLQADSTFPQGYILVNGIAAATIKQDGSVLATSLSATGNIFGGTNWNLRTSSYAIQDSDCGGVVALSGTTTLTLSVLNNNFRQGFKVSVVRLGSGGVTFYPTPSSTYNPVNSVAIRQATSSTQLTNTFSAATLIYSGVPTTGWILFGDLV
jgi:hypothetical protein